MILAEKVTIIMGAGGHVAKALAGVFAREGSAVAGCDISATSLEGFTAAVREVGGKSLATPCDLRDWSSLRSAVDRAVNEFGRVDILINTATARTTPVWKGLEECSHGEITEVMEVGPIGAMGAMKAVFPYMKEKGGKIINFGSGSGRNPAAGLGPYGISKAAMHSLTKHAAKEWGKYKINVNGILPLVMTPVMEMTLKEDPDRLKPFMPPLGWFGDAERDIGRVALFLASSASDYVTGQNLPVDGGSDMML
jgi:NAD(P)-dependent dehydrogenase (short-subunit alcohol dehydrogenase family)